MRRAGLAVLVGLLLLGAGCRRREGEAAGGGSNRFVRMGPMVAGRMEPRVAPLADGRWLITSGTFVGEDPETDTSGCTEVFDPASQAFFELPPMQTPRISHALAPLPDGDVLVVGGWAKGKALETLERFLGREGRFEALPMKLSKPRSQGMALTLRDGRVAVFGGLGPDGNPMAEVEVVDFALGRTWVACRLNQPRGRGFQATLLEDGRVLVTGGEGKDGAPLAAVERVDPVRGRVDALPPMALPRARHAALRLEDGSVLLVGGLTGSAGKTAPEARCARLDPQNGRSLPVASLPEPRVGAALDRLTDGRVLLVGGWNAEGALASSLFFDPRKGAFQPGPTLLWGRADTALLPLDRGRALVVGGGLEVAERYE